MSRRLTGIPFVFSCVVVGLALGLLTLEVGCAVAGDGQAIAGDLNGDSQITEADVQAFRDAAATVAGFMGSQSGDPAFNSEADLDGDGRITWQDLQTLLQAAGIGG